MTTTTTALLPRLDGARLAIAGHFEYKRQPELMALLKDFGVQIVKRIHPDTDALIAGRRPGRQSTEAERLHIPVVSEEQLLRSLRYELGVNTRLSALRRLVHGLPSTRRWQRLCDHLDLWPDYDDLQLAINYLLPHLHAW
ncbi:MAG: BRCT domain-containing protein, partial [Myxococcota bacterium]